jgi:DNA (cytosine-5)-methyltransferase 1
MIKGLGSRLEDSAGPKTGRPRVLDLFSGIGGFALAFEAAGFETVAFAEIEPYPCKVLAQHWPAVPNLGDVRGIDGRDFAGVDVVCGGFPCQDISAAGRGAGIEGAKSGLWVEMLRIIGGARPAFCLIENSPQLYHRGIDAVLSDLEKAGYACRPFVVGAGNAGAPHQRARVFVVAYSNSERLQRGGPEGVSGVLQVDSGREGEEYLQAPARRAVRLGQEAWTAEPRIPRVDDGLPTWPDELKALGNSIVPAVAYPFAAWIYGALSAKRSRSAEGAEGSP